jgi:hypothetical protein
MAVDNAAVLKRAKELCEQDGYAWELDHTVPSAEPIIPRITLSEEARQEYLTRARAELGVGDA